MSMTRRDFEALARAIKEAHSGDSAKEDYKAAVRVVNNLLPYLRKSNPAFDNKRFIEACGMKAVPLETAAVFDYRFALCA